jgi:hypothetical protein
MITKANNTLNQEVTKHTETTNAITAELTRLQQNGVVITEQIKNDVILRFTQMRDQSIFALTDFKTQATAILLQLKTEKGQITTAMASDFITKSANERDKVVAAANDTYQKTVLAIAKQRNESGTMTQQQAITAIQNAQKQRDNVIRKAEGMHTGVVKEVSAMGNDVVGNVNLSNGRVISEWEKFKMRASIFGHGLIKNYADGIALGMGPLQFALKKVGDAIWKAIHQSYNPLTPSQKWGQDLIDNYVFGMNKQIPNMLDTLSGINGNLRLSMSGATAGSGNTNNSTININVGTLIGDESSMRELEKRIARATKQNATGSGLSVNSYLESQNE